MKRLFTIMMLLCAVWLTNAQTPPTIIYVTQQGAGNKNGFSWDNAMSNVQDAIDKAALWGIKQVWVAEGTYVNSHNSWGEVYVRPIILHDGVSLYGGFAGNEPADYDLSLRNLTTNTSILDGNHSTRVLTQYNDFVNPITVDGFTIQNGHANWVGGAVLKGNATISHCIIRNNSAEVDVDDDDLISNRKACGGLYCSSASVISCKIIQNEISYLGSSWGRSISAQVRRSYAGGIVTVNSTISNCLIYNNNTNQETAYQCTGGVVSDGSTLINCDIVRNNINVEQGAGGLYCNGAGNTFVNCVIWGNNGSDGQQNVFSSNLNYNTQPVFSHCAVEAPSGSNLYNYLTSGETNIILDSENNVFSDGGVWCPNFTNPNNGDFTLKPTSILINGGTTDGITPPEFDLNRNARIQQNSIDIGCYEFTKNGTYGYTGIVYVKPTGAGDSTGTSWANAMPDLQTAVNTAHALGDGCQVWVATGTYYGNRTNSDSRAAFTMKEGVNVYGGFAGDEPSNYNLSQRNYSINTTILDGQQIRRVLDQLKVFETQTTWDGFTIRNGAFLGCQLMGNAVLSHCEICNNRISDSLYFFTGDGGGVWARNSTLSFCNIHNNSNQTGGDGGGIFVDTCTIINCRINNNISKGNGGGVRSIASEFINCEISNNTTNGEYYTTGGGAYANSSSFVNCNIVNNKTEHGVGGVACVEEFHWDYDYEEEEYYSYELVSFTNCVIWGNRQGDKQSNILAPDDYQTLNVHVVMNNCAVESGYDGEKNIALASTNEGVGTFFPRFVLPTAGAGANYSGGDWRLQNNSVLINRGDTTVTGLPITDLAGNSRIQQGQIDIGCYESASQGVVLPGTLGPIIYVTQNGAGSRNGTSWDNAMSNLDWAVSLASMYDSVQVWVATGIYYGNTSAENAFTMRENVNVYGGFAGNEPANFDLSQRELSINPTVLDGQNSRIVLCQLRHFRHITEWDGFILRNGYSPVGSSSNAGGAYLKANGKLSHCSIHNNNGYAVVGYGRKNNIGYGHGFVSNCLLRNNSLGANGGTYTNCSIVANGGEGVSAGNFKNCVLWGNEAKLSNTYYANFSHCAVEGGFGSGYITLESANDGAEGFYPRFVSPTAGAGLNYNGGDWRLQNGSVCINNGNTAGLDSSSMDLAGNSRVLHGQVDIGCYESFSDDMVEIPQYPDNIVYVTQTGSGTNDGSSWDNAMADIQQAMTYAAIYDSVNVWVATGTYYGDTTAFSTEDASANAFHMRDGVQVYGGLAGNETSSYDLSQRDFATNTTILDGQNSRRVLLQDYDFRFKSEWNGFTLQNGHTPWNGAGCYLTENGVLNHCVISNNTISFQGGGGVFLIGSASLLNCIVRNNSAMMPNYTPEHSFGSGTYTNRNTAGGVCHVPGNLDKNATIRNCIISNNNGSYCGGVLLRGVDMTGCLICNNSGEIGGGLIRNVNNWDMLSNTVTNCDIVNNKSTNSLVGGVFYSGFENYYYDYYYVYDGAPDTLTFANCIIWGNKSDGLISNIGNSGTTFASFKYCAVEQDGVGSTNLPLLSENEGDGVFHPRFVAPTAGAGAEYYGGDWTLQEGSTLINKGNSNGIHVPAYDLAGNPRIQQGRIDIGCYEYNASDSSITTCDTIYKEIYGSFCKSFTWNETTYTTSGDYVQHFFNANGCDSIVTLHLIIQSADTVITSDTICGGVRTMLINASEEYLQENYYLYNHSSDTCQITYLYNNMFDESDGITIIDVDGESWNGTYYDIVSTTTSLHELDCDSTYIHHNIIKFTDAIVTWDTGCGKYICNGDTLTQSGTYKHYFTNTVGCDSVETLILCMRPSVYEDITDTANESYTFNGFTYHESGVYTQILDIDVVIEPDELYFDEYYGAWWWYDEEWGEGWSELETVTLSGCKIVTLNLTINCINYSDLYEEFCDSYVWNDSVYTTSGDYTHTFSSANGCDSVVTLHLIVNESKNTETTAGSCDSYTWNDSTYTASGDYTQTFTAANGCDSVVTLHLTILPSPTPAITGVTTVCEGQTAMLTATGGMSYLWEDGTTTTSFSATESGVYIVTVTNANGCSATASATVTVNPLPEVAVTGNTYICPGGSTVLTATGAATYMWSNGSTNAAIPVNAFGQYSVIGTSAEGCFSTASVTVLVSQPPVITINGNTNLCTGESTTLTATGGVSYMWSNGSADSAITVNTAGNWQVIGYNENNCSNMASATVNVWQPAATDLYITSFDSCYTWFGTPRCESGDYTHTLQTIHGCDSVITLHLTLEDAIVTEFSATACDSYTWNGATYSQSGNYTQSFTAVNGNDSIVTLHLTINTSKQMAFADSTCTAYVWNGQTYAVSGDYIQTFTAVNGCDSTVTLHLTVNHSTAGDTTAVACESFSWHGNTYTQSGNYTHTMTNAVGCDSVVTLHLTVNQTVAVTDTRTVCASELPIVWNGVQFAGAGTQTATLQTANGCDSVVTMTLTVNHSTAGDTTAVACESFSWHGNTYTQSGNYTYTTTNVAGCDSVVTLHLTVMADFVPQVTVSGALTACGNETATLSLTGTYHDYLWSTGDTTATITVGSAGYYWVTIGDGNGCTSVSEPVHLGVSELVSETPALCMVGVEDQHNLVVWEPLADTDVAEYRLYRENGQANIFEPLAVIPAGSGNAYADTTADPSVRAWRYKITAADTCGGETPMSALHKTVHLTINQGLGNSYNLIWTPYEGFEFASYRLYRGTANNNLQLIQTMPSTLTSFTDQNPDGDALFYQIEVVMDGSCVQETRDITFTGARSNIVYNGVPVATDVAVEACESYDWNGEVLTSSGEYTRSFNSVLGYDSIVTLHLTIHQPATSEFTVSCPDSCYTWNGTEYCASGDYTQTLQTVHGCDSVVTLHLTITVGIDEHDLAGSVKVFPNPANDVVNVQCTMYNVQMSADLHVFDVYGKLVQTVPMAGETTILNISTLADGMYFVRVTTEDGMVTKPFVVKR